MEAAISITIVGLTLVGVYLYRLSSAVRRQRIEQMQRVARYAGVRVALPFALIALVALGIGALRILIPFWLEYQDTLEIAVAEAVSIAQTCMLVGWASWIGWLLGAKR